ncbi:MAG TPA: class I SAM-dependent methyltransferase [Anaerolineae bacterium]|nr:class I SAM-dependent methyltransferase [Anaerolineae bacterium]
MRSEVAAQLVALNQTFYDSVAVSFAESRQTPQPGFEMLLDYLPLRWERVLDVGCGNGRWGHYLAERGDILYTGVDFSQPLLSEAEMLPEARWLTRNLAEEDCLEGVGEFDLIACLAVLQHVPSFERRAGLLRGMRGCISAGGRLFLSTWQFLNSSRQRRKILDWGEVGLRAEDVEEHDYLLSWDRGVYGRRYVCWIGEAETARLAAASGWQVMGQFYSDGREGNLSLYTVLEPV